MSRLLRTVGPVLALVLAPGFAPAATPKEINDAIVRGAAFLRHQGGGNELGKTALVGLALLESGARVDEPVIKAITAAVREGSYTEIKTYHLTLALLYLDRNADPVDAPLIQMLAARLAFGQTNGGGWTYTCMDQVSKEDEQYLRARLKPAAGVKLEPGKLHPDVVAYMRALEGRQRLAVAGDDNSNTQFGLLGLWAARKHGVPVDRNLDLVVERFIQSQNANTGGWPYTGMNVGMDQGTPSMTCAGLLGLATGVARREERLTKPEKKPDPAPKDKDPPKSNDPFFTPAPKPAEKNPPKRPPDRLDVAVWRGLAGLGVTLVESVRNGRGRLVLAPNGGFGRDDLYFFWSLERVGVVYGLEKIGGIDWYETGAETLVRTQAADGSWGNAGYDANVNTAFALLFLTRSNVVKDLSQKIQRTTTDSELRASTVPNPGADPKNAPMVGEVPARPADPMTRPDRPDLPVPVEDESAKLANELIQSPPAKWSDKLAELRDKRGGDYTRALVLAIPKLEGDRKKQAREALSERLTRMSPETLREMMKATDPELRRAAVLAAAMKDDKSHVPDLINRIEKDDDESVVRAARAGLKSLSGGQDFGPAPGATKADRDAAAKAWRDWWAKQKQ
jgi:hypothetical protein